MAELDARQRAILEFGTWFAALPAPLRDAAIAIGQRRALIDGAALHVRGELPCGWYGILSGAIKVRAFSADGRESVLTFLEPGAWFGEISLIDGLPRTHDAVAYGDTSVLVVAPAEFQALLMRFPDLPLHLLRLQCQRIRLLFAALEDLNTKPLEQRLAKQLLNLAQHYGVADGGGVRIGLRLPQEQLAQLVGASRQRVNAELSEWVRRGWIAVRYGDISVLDAAALRTVAGCD
jgi:CRP/FNR family transcriptional regulator, cyclic AMP receptor protein